MQISWSDFKNNNPEKFDKIVNSLVKNRKIDRAEAIDILDSEYTFEQDSEGRILVTRDNDNRYIMF